MADQEETQEPPKRKASRTPLLIGLALAILGAGGGFYAVQSGLWPFDAVQESQSEGAKEADHGAVVETLPDVAFVPIAPVVISVGLGAERLHLRFSAELEVKAAYEADVEALAPRIVDVMNTYLRALKLSDLEESTALVRLRAQLLRRIQVVTGGGRVNDLLIMEFVLN